MHIPSPYAQNRGIWSRSLVLHPQFLSGIRGVSSSLHYLPDRAACRIVLSLIL
jgi:hypothetical protein